MKHLTSALCASLLLSTLAAFPALGEELLFTVSGKNSSGAAIELTITDAMLSQIGVTQISTKVVSQGDFVRTVRGAKVEDVLNASGLVGDTVHVVALDGYAVDLPRGDFAKYPALFATEIDGKKLSVRDKGPAWIIYPVSDFKELDDPVFEARSVWQLKTVTVHNQ